MFQYMTGKGDVGSYRKAFDYSLKIFALKDPLKMAKNSGSNYDPVSTRFTLKSLGQSLSVKYPEGTVVFEDSSLTPVWSWRLIVLNYLSRADNTSLAGRLISYRELENGQVFYPAFLRESINPLVKQLSGENDGRIKQACLDLDATIEGKADISAVFPFLPRFPVTVKIWLKDEEIGGSANILFDAGANHYLHTEDIAVVGNLLSYFLIKQVELVSDSLSKEDPAGSITFSKDNS